MLPAEPLWLLLAFVLFAGIFLGEVITFFDIGSLAIVGAGIYLLRNKLAKMEDE